MTEIIGTTLMAYLPFGIDLINNKVSEPFCGSLFLFQYIYISVNSRSAHIADSRKLGDIKLTAYVRGIMPVKTIRHITT